MIWSAGSRSWKGGVPDRPGRCSPGLRHPRDAGTRPDRDRYTEEDFLEAVAGPRGPLQRVDVHKRRVRYTVNGCTSEVTDLVANGSPTRTIAIESTDQAAVLDGVRQMGLGGYLNTNYGAGLRALIDGRPERYAVIDVGTNSVILRIAERADKLDHAHRSRRDHAPGRRSRGDRFDLARGSAAHARRDRRDGGRCQAAGVLAIVAVGTAGLRGPPTPAS